MGQILRINQHFPSVVFNLPNRAVSKKIVPRRGIFQAKIPSHNSDIAQKPASDNTASAKTSVCESRSIIMCAGSITGLQKCRRKMHWSAIIAQVQRSINSEKRTMSFAKNCENPCSALCALSPRVPLLTLELLRLADIFLSQIFFFFFQM